MKKYKSVFIDADAFVALNTPQNSNYMRAIDIAKHIEDQSMTVNTCTYVILELATVINKYYQKDLGPILAEAIMDDPQINLIHGDEFIRQGIELMTKQSSKNVSLNDCVYFAIAKDLSVDFIFSFDKHWQQNGFKLLTPDIQ